MFPQMMTNCDNVVLDGILTHVTYAIQLHITNNIVQPHHHSQAQPSKSGRRKELSLDPEEFVHAGPSIFY